MEKPKTYYLFENLVLGGFFIVMAGSDRMADYMLDKTMRCTGGALSLTEDQAKVITSGEGAIIE